MDSALNCGLCPVHFVTEEEQEQRILGVPSFGCW